MDAAGLALLGLLAAPLALAAVAVILVVLAHLRRPIRQVLLQLFGLIFEPIRELDRALGAAQAAVAGWSGAVLSRLFPDPERRITQVLGTLVYSVVFLGLAVPDAGLWYLTICAIFGDCSPEREGLLELGAETLGLVLVLSTVLAAGLVLFDLVGLTGLTPVWDRASDGLRLALGFSVFMLSVLVAWAVWTLLWWRMKQAMEQAVYSAAADGGHTVLYAMAALGLAALILAALTLPAFLTGLGLGLAGLLGLLAVGTGAVLVFLRVAGNILERMFQLADSLLELGAAPGRAVWNWLAGSRWGRKAGLKPLDDGAEGPEPGPGSDGAAGGPDGGSEGDWEDPLGVGGARSSEDEEEQK